MCVCVCIYPPWAGPFGNHAHHLTPPGCLWTAHMSSVSPRSKQDRDAGSFTTVWCFTVSGSDLVLSEKTLNTNPNHRSVWLLVLTWPCRSVFSSIRAQVRVWTLSATQTQCEQQSYLVAWWWCYSLNGSELEHPHSSGASTFIWYSVRVALEVSFGEMGQHSFSFLRLTLKSKLSQENSGEDKLIIIHTDRYMGHRHFYRNI